mmetsp:Transcript_11990/g.27057  ORF Transcript_11990/g.27057 Transcript_11990/m.27057 type:complete len:185 (+) Transcript_11990:60-614(+)
MLFRSTIFAAIAACVVAKKAPNPQDAMIPDFNIPTDSKTGKRLLSKARRVEQNNNNNNNNQNNNNNYNGNYNQNQNMEAAEICQQSYEMAAKCESNLGSYLGQYYYTDTSGCDYIHNILPNLQRATRKIATGSSSSASVSSPAATAFAVIFGLTTALLGAYSFFLYRKIHRAKVNLAQAEMGIA